MLALLQWPDGLLLGDADVRSYPTRHDSPSHRTRGNTRTNQTALSPMSYLRLWPVPSASEQGEEASRRHVWGMCPWPSFLLSAKLKSITETEDYNREVDYLISFPVL